VAVEVGEFGLLEYGGVGFEIIFAGKNPIGEMAE